MAFVILPAPYDMMVKSMVMGYLDHFFEKINAETPEQICAKYFSCLEMGEIFHPN
jgi:hypothetical protein